MERAAGGRDLELDGRGARRARVLRAARPDRALPLEHLHGDAARDPGGRRATSSSSTATATTSACRSTTSSARRSSTDRTPRCSSTSAATSPSTSSRIAALCRAEGIVLLEDCAHAHGAAWNGQAGGQRGATPESGRSRPTKTISTGEGGMLVSRRRRAGRVRTEPSATTASPTTRRPGLNYRMNEFTAALGIVGVRAARGDRRLEERRSRAQQLDPLYPEPGRASRRDGLRPLQVHRLPAARAVDRARSTTSPATGHGPPRRPPEHRLGGGEPLVRAALLPARGHAALQARRR